MSDVAPRTTRGDLLAFPGVGRCDACDGPLDADYKADEDGAFRVCSRCDREAPHEWHPLGLIGTLRFLVSRAPRAASWRRFGFELNVERVPGGNAVWIERRR